MASNRVNPFILTAGTVQEDAESMEVVGDVKSNTTTLILAQDDVHVFHKCDMSHVHGRAQLSDVESATSANESNANDVD